MRKIKVKVELELTMIIDEGVDVGEIIDDLEYEFTDTTTQATIEDTEIIDYEVVDSK